MWWKLCKQQDLSGLLNPFSGQTSFGLAPVGSWRTLCLNVSFVPRFKDALLNTVGHRAAERSLQLGLLYSPQEAFKIGLVDELVPEEKIQARAAEVMAQWLAIPGGTPRPSLVREVRTRGQPTPGLCLGRA